MARQNHGPLSRAKGKLGGVVYQQYEGMQISREYQPVVKNPQSDKQVENRAKFKLSSQIVAQFSEIFNTRLAKLSGYTRIRRGAAVNAIYGVMDMQLSGGPAALVANVINAINNKSVSAITGPAVTFSNGDFSIVAEADLAVIYEVAYYDATTGNLKSVSTEFYDSDGTAKIVTGPTAGERAVIMVLSMVENTEEGRATITNASSTETGWENEIIRAIASGDVEVSNLVGTVQTGA